MAVAVIGLVERFDGCRGAPIPRASAPETDPSNATNNIYTRNQFAYVTCFLVFLQQRACHCEFSTASAAALFTTQNGTPETHSTVSGLGDAVVIVWAVGFGLCDRRGAVGSLFTTGLDLGAGIGGNLATVRDPCWAPVAPAPISLESLVGRQI